MLLESLPPRVETQIQPESVEIDSSLQTEIYYGLFAAAYRHRVVFPHSFEKSSGFLHQKSLTKSNLVSSPPLNPTPFDDINEVIDHVKLSLPKSKLERETHVIQLEQKLMRVGSSDQEDRISKKDFDTAIQILATIDQELDGGIEYLLPLAASLAQFAAGLANEAEKVANGSRGLVDNTTSVERNLSSDEISIASSILTAKGMHPEIAKAMFVDGEHFGINDYFITSKPHELKDKWLQFRPSHLRALKPITDSVVQTLAHGSVEYLETVNLTAKHRLEHYLTVKSISGVSIGDFVAGIEGADFDAFYHGARDFSLLSTILTIDIAGENYTSNDKNLPTEYSPLVLWLQQKDQFGNIIPYTPIVKLVRFDKESGQFIVNYAGQRNEVDTMKPRSDQDWHHIFSFSRNPSTGYAQASISPNRMRRVGIPLGLCDHTSQLWQQENEWTQELGTELIPIFHAYSRLVAQAA